jgi:magnesium chelatase subunit I
MSAEFKAWVLPYSRVVGQEQLKLALELNFIARGIGGVLISGQRGTAKSTAVRAFCLMMYDGLPVTLPINATDDRVVGGWRLDALMRQKTTKQAGLLEMAGKHGLLYIDEVNLLDDHLVNIILDVTSTGILPVEREAISRQLQLDFALVATMNPEEGQLRPQLLDRFGLMVEVENEADAERRLEILDAVLQLDEARYKKESSPWLEAGREADLRYRRILEEARGRLYEVSAEAIKPLCADIAAAFQAPGHRGDMVMALAARALAAREEAGEATAAHARVVAPLALRHRRPGTGLGGQSYWSDEEDGKTLDDLLDIDQS